MGTHKVRGKCPACDGPAQIYYEDKTVENLADGIPQELIVNCPNSTCENFPKTSGVAKGSRCQRNRLRGTRGNLGGADTWADYTSCWAHVGLRQRRVR